MSIGKADTSSPGKWSLMIKLDITARTTIVNLDNIATLNQSLESNESEVSLTF